MTYLESSAERFALASLPLESSIRNVPLERVIMRLKTERGLVEGGIVPVADKPVLQAILLVERAPDKALAQSIQSVALQSYPGVRCVLAPLIKIDTEMLRRFGESVDPQPVDLAIWSDLCQDPQANIGKADFVTFLRHGDRLHPSVAAWIAIELRANRAVDVITWGALQPDGSGNVVWAQRNPSLHRVSMLHFPYLRNAFAVSSLLAATYQGDLVSETQHNYLHLFQIWLSQNQDVRWFSHPEFFLIRADEFVNEQPEVIARHAFTRYIDSYTALFEELSYEYTCCIAPDSAIAPYKLIPRRVPDTLSVIIPFRDKPEITSRALHSIARQTFAGSVEIMLINNQSSKDSLIAIHNELMRLPSGLQCRIVDYDAPFNHSIMCQLGVRESHGEILLFMNNDAELCTINALTELSAWAARPGIASVGVAIENTATNEIAAGMMARLAPTPYFNSIVEERSDSEYTPFVREVFGNTFAFAAISRTVFDILGGLDALRFPNGYNDVEYACRARRQGYTHITLGHIRVSHVPGQSRGRTDESIQKTLLRILYPEFSVAALTDLCFDDMAGKLRSKPKGIKA